MMLSCLQIWWQAMFLMFANALMTDKMFANPLMTDKIFANALMTDNMMTSHVCKCVDDWQDGDVITFHSPSSHSSTGWMMMTTTNILFMVILSCSQIWWHNMFVANMLMTDKMMMQSPSILHHRTARQGWWGRKIWRKNSVKLIHQCQRSYSQCHQWAHLPLTRALLSMS